MKNLESLDAFTNKEKVNEAINHQYVGDGVYAKFTGWSVDISVNDHRNPVAVVFEQDVLQSLVNFARQNGMKIK